jgi:hypothetical protein
MNAPIPVSEALRLLSMAIDDCDKATPGIWRLGEEPDCVDADADFPVACTYQPHMTLAKSNAVAIVLARATMRPMLEAISTRLRMGLWLNGEILDDQDIYLPLVALRDYYDRTRPDWRTR